MIDSPEELSRRLIAEGEKTRTFFAGLTDEEWRRQAYTDGACWSIREILAHFLAAEVAFQELIANIQSGGSGSPEDFDLNVYNERNVKSLSDDPPDVLLSSFVRARTETAAQVSQLDPEDLLRMGRHPFLGVTQLIDMIKMIYRHNQIHQREVRKILSGGETAP